MHLLIAGELVFSFRFFTGRKQKLNIKILVKRNSRQTVWYFHILKVSEDGAVCSVVMLLWQLYPSNISELRRGEGASEDKGF